MTRPIVALLSDFGLSDTYVGQMKGALLAACPDASLVDLSHGVPPQAVAVGAVWLARAANAFPPGTIHLAVVDPGVGTSRRALAIATRRGFFVGPDNGLLERAAREAGVRRVVELGARGRGVAPTFHGRDVFAPAAGRLARGDDLDALGRRVDARSLVRSPVGRPRRRGATLVGRVLFVDAFGNAVTDVDGDAARGALCVVAGPFELGPLGRTYADVGPGEPIALVSSFGLLEIAVRDGSAALRGLRVGDPVTLRFDAPKRRARMT